VHQNPFSAKALLTVFNSRLFCTHRIIGTIGKKLYRPQKQTDGRTNKENKHRRTDMRFKQVSGYQWTLLTKPCLDSRREAEIEMTAQSCQSILSPGAADSSFDQC